MGNQKKKELTRRFDEVYPGPHSNLRISLQATNEKLFLVKGRGARIWDVDGNEYIDFLNGAGPTILGHCHSEYIQVLKDSLDKVSPSIGSGMLYTPHDIELAEKIEYYVPCAEKVKFCVTGTEAVQMAIRLARAHTKRRYFIRFEGHYHGWADNVIGGVLDKELIKAIRESGKVVREPFPIESDQDFRGTVGKDAAASRQSLMLPWNDIEVLEKVLERYGGEVAMIHMEPIVCNHFCMYPLPGYLERVREWCVKYGIVLSFDEVITGFRVGLGGAQQELGITPDITTLGKAIAGGMPLSAIVGKNEIMELFTNRTVLGPGTFNGYPFGLAAALATIRILEKDNGAIYKEIDRVQKRLMDGMRKISLSRGIPMLIQGCRGAFYTCFVDKEIAYVEEDVADVDREKSIKFWENMAQEGILFLFGGRWYISAGVTDADVDRTLECADRVLGKL